jgi:hypothetical protein
MPAHSSAQIFDDSSAAAADPTDPDAALFAAIAEFDAARVAYAHACRAACEGGNVVIGAAYRRLLFAVNGINVAPLTPAGAAALLRAIGASHDGGDGSYVWGVRWHEDPEDTASPVIVATPCVGDILKTVDAALESLCSRRKPGCAHRVSRASSGTENGRTRPFLLPVVPSSSPESSGINRDTEIAVPLSRPPRAQDIPGL